MSSLSLCQACRVASRRLWFVRRERGLEEQDVVVLVFCCCAVVLSGTSQIFPGNPWEAMTTWHVAGAGQVGTLEAPSAESTHCHPFSRRTHCFYGSLTSLRCSNIQMELSCKGSHQTTTFYPQYSRLINTYPLIVERPAQATGSLCRYGAAPVLVKTHRPQTINLASSADVCPELEPPGLPSLGQPGLDLRSAVTKPAFYCIQSWPAYLCRLCRAPVGFFHPVLHEQGTRLLACRGRQSILLTSIRPQLV